MGEKPLRAVAVLMLLTDLLAMLFSTSHISPAAVPSWVAWGVIVLVSVRMFFVGAADNSVYQEMIMVACFIVAAVDLFWAWAWVDSGLEDESVDWVWSLPYLAAVAASLYTAKKHTPSNIFDDRRRLTGFLMLISHGMAFFFGATFYGDWRWAVYVAGALISARLFTAKLEEVNAPYGTENAICGAATFVGCLLVGAGDLWITSLCISNDQDSNDAPAQWILVFPNIAAACASFYTAGTLFQDRRILTDILVTV